jgi:inhibitor of KinA
MISYVPNQPLLEVLQIVEQSLHAELLPLPVRTFWIPMCAGHDMAPDLRDVARIHDLTPPEVLTRYTAQAYRIDAIGFSPGFPYLAGLPAKLATPRLSTPRSHVPAGSVAIGGTQTGIYPISSPGGWNIIGRTPLRLFQPSRTPPIPYHPGDLLHFVLISADEFDTMIQQPHITPVWEVNA